MIIFKNVTKKFGDDPPAVEDLSFQVNKGEFVFLTGHSGSGKSTLLKILTKEYTPTSGEVEFEGESLRDIKGSKIHHHRRKIGVVFQDYRLLPELNVWENIALALQITNRPQSEIEERVTDLLDLVQLTEKAFYFPAQLSGGEAQRVGIARALATAPTIILADEPTGNLDPDNTMMIARLFSKINELGTTILLATHDVSVLNALNYRRLHLEKGRLVQDTGSTQLPAQPPQAAPSVQSPGAPSGEKPAEAPKIETTPDHKEEKPEKKKEETKKGFSFPKISIKLPFGKSEKKKAEKEKLDSDSAEEKKSSEEKDLEKQMTQMLVQIENLE